MAQIRILKPVLPALILVRQQGELEKVAVALQNAGRFALKITESTE